MTPFPKWFRKLLKVFQYGFVIFAEFNLIRHVIRLKGGGIASQEVLKDWHTRLRKLGSAISTSRMVLRLGMWISTLKFLVTQAKKKLAGQPLDNKVIWLTELCTLVGGFADNMYLFYRVSRRFFA